jgi:hypothetical protein
MTQFFYPFSLIYMTDTTNSQPKKSNAGTSTPSKDSQEPSGLTRDQAATQIPDEVWRAIQYLEYRRLRHKHPHC